jgi:hypothetical protein
MTPVAQRDRPEWDGVHGRMIILLPLQNRFTIEDRDFRLPSLPPERPVPDRIDADLYTKIKIGILRDTTEAKRMKDGRRIVRAGNYAFLRLCPTSIKKAYDLTDSLGSVVAVRDILFLEDFATHQQRQNRAIQAIRTLKAETENILDTNRRRMDTWERQRKDWEIRLVHYVWDNGLGVFPPYVTAREQLGETEMDIPNEWVQKPFYQSNHYCGCCLEPMPLICHVCRDDINNQQEEAQNRLEEEAANAAAEAEEQAAAIAVDQAAEADPPEVVPIEDDDSNDSEDSNASDDRMEAMPERPIEEPMQDHDHPMDEEAPENNNANDELQREREGDVINNEGQLVEVPLPDPIQGRVNGEIENLMDMID